MNDKAKAENLDNRQPKTVPPIPQHWLKRANNPKPLSIQEMEDFIREAGPHVKAWLADINRAAECLLDEVADRLACERSIEACRRAVLKTCQQRVVK